jgi:hypothetical protein
MVQWNQVTDFGGKNNPIQNSPIGPIMFGAKLKAFWNQPAGPKTVFFWAPTMKWGIVFATINDLSKPAESVSIPQTSALALTGLIWSRYSTQIIPVNYNLFAVNIFVALTNFYQLYRKYESGAK